MKIGNKHYRTIWLHPSDPTVVQIIDQRTLPFSFEIENISNWQMMATAIKEMHLRGAGLIGAAAGYGMYLATLDAGEKTFMKYLQYVADELKSTRPTAVNLARAVDIQIENLNKCSDKEGCITTSRKTAQLIADEDVLMCRKIGQNGLKLIEKISKRKNGNTVNILTHCNAGWLAFVDYGSATAPVYAAHDAGIAVHVWVDETRPRNQGARLTAWELLQHGVPHTVIPDNAGGHLMQHGMVDIVITGADRVTAAGDAANKIGTYLKALAAKDNDIPFYVALPSSTFDWEIDNGVDEIPIEQRDAREVKYISGFDGSGEREVLIMPEGSPVANYGFDVTPAGLITGLITEKGVCRATKQDIAALFGR